MSVREIEITRAKAMISGTSGMIAIEESSRDHCAVRAAVRDLIGLTVDDLPIRLVPIGQSPLLVRVENGGGTLRFFLA